MTVDVIVIGLAISLHPLPLTACLIVLPSKRGILQARHEEGRSLLFGWLVSQALMVTVTVLATGNNPPKPNRAPSLAALAAKIASGVGLVADRDILPRDREDDAVSGAGYAGLDAAVLAACGSASSTPTPWRG